MKLLLEKGDRPSSDALQLEARRTISRFRL